MSDVKMPEPAVKSTGPGPDDMHYSFTRWQMESYAAAKVREALEEAAEIAKANYLEHLGRREVEVDEGCDQERWNIAVTSQALAFSVMEHSIRALIPQQ